jgi:hypothetical protein
VDDRVWLVVDDVHELGPEALRQLELLVLRAPPGLRFVLAARHDVRLGLHRLRLEGGCSRSASLICGSPWPRRGSCWPAFPAEQLVADAELAAVAAGYELAQGSLETAERYLGLAERAPTPPGRRSLSGPDWQIAGAVCVSAAPFMAPSPWTPRSCGSGWRTTQSILNDPLASSEPQHAPGTEGVRNASSS